MSEVRLLPCPFCGHTDIGVKDIIVAAGKAEKDTPSSMVKRVWAYCRYCQAEGPKRTVEVVYDDEIISAARLAWNRRDAKAAEVGEQWAGKNSETRS